MKNEIINIASEIMSRLEKEHGVHYYSSVEFLNAINRLNERIAKSSKKFRKNSINKYITLHKKAR